MDRHATLAMTGGAMTKILNYIYGAGVHTHGTAKGDGTGFLRSEFNNSLTTGGEQFLNFQGGDGKGSGAGISVGGV